jgi:glutathione S-transferase
MDLYYGRNSGNSSRCVFALYESGAQWRPRLVDVRQGENATPEYRAINPMGKIPALADGSVRLWESNAINWYVAERHPEAGLLPRSIEGRAAVQRWLFFQVAHVTPACAKVYFFTNERVRSYWGLAPDEAAFQAGTKELARFLPVLEGALDGREWLEGDFSLADLAYLPHLTFLAEGGYDFAAYPRVSAWLARLSARPAWAKTRALVFAW